MTTFKAFIRRHPVLTYYALTFAISWGGVLILGAPYGMPTTSEQFAKHWPIVFLPFFFGPSIACLVLMGLVHGKDGFRELLSRLLKWRVDARWYVVALLTAPLLVTPMLLILSLISPVFLPDIVTTTDKVGLIVLGLAVGLIEGGFMEELGWTGFATPELRRRYSVVATGLIVGALWATWHFLVTFWGSGDSSGVFDLFLFLPPCLFYIGILPAYRVLMIWVYDRTASLFVAMLMHASLTATTLFILSPAARGGLLMIYYILLTIVIWIIVAVVVLIDSRQHLPKAMMATSEQNISS